jgi:post-segregation antitoxin (ccd killing protein)
MPKQSEYQYTIRKHILINKIQYDSLKVLESYGINISQFIRAAIKEKLQRDWKEIKESKKEILPY